MTSLLLTTWVGCVYIYIYICKFNLYCKDMQSAKYVYYIMYIYIYTPHTISKLYIIGPNNFFIRYATFQKRSAQAEKNAEPGQMRLPYAGAQAGQYSDNDPIQKAKIRSIAMNLVVDCDMPMYAVERPGFRRYLAEEDPCIAPISSKWPISFILVVY